MKMNYFWDWLESAEFYDKEYRYDIDRYAGNNPKVFAHWFPQGQDRIYIPFEIDGNKFIQIAPNTPLPDYRDKLEAILDANGYTLADFRKGLVSPKNNSKRQQRIVPVLQQLAKQETDLQQIIKIYERAQIRLNRGMNMFAIAISQDPHDIALMTYDRPWKMTSCMRLKDDKTEGGAKWHQVYDEVQDGGLIAYVIEPEDKEIKKPYARVLLRRFSNNNNTASIALCEETVYGLEIPGFKETVKNWLNQHNPTAFGNFTRKGSEWSDTFGRHTTITPNHSQLNKDNQDKLWDMLDNLDLDQLTQQIASIVAARKNFDDEFVTKVILRANKEFKQYKQEAAKVATRRVYTFYIPRAAMELGIPVNNIEDIIKAFTLDGVAANISTEHSAAPEITKYLMPVLMQMTHNIDAYNIHDLANSIERNKELQSEEFINSIPTAAIEEMIHYVSNQDVKFIMVQKIIHQMKKNLPGLAKKYQNGDEAALDTITDEWIGPILDHLPREKVNWFFQIVKELLPTDLYKQLYGHTYR